MLFIKHYQETKLLLTFFRCSLKTNCKENEESYIRELKTENIDTLDGSSQAGTKTLHVEVPIDFSVNSNKRNLESRVANREEISNQQGEEEMSNQQGEKEISNQQEEGISNRQGEEEISNRQGEEEISNRQGEEEISNRQGEEEISSQKGEEEVSNQQGEKEISNQQEEEISSQQEKTSNKSSVLPSTGCVVNKNVHFNVRAIVKLGELNIPHSHREEHVLRSEKEIQRKDAVFTLETNDGHVQQTGLVDDSDTQEIKIEDDHTLSLNQKSDCNSGKSLLTDEIIIVPVDEPKGNAGEQNLATETPQQELSNSQPCLLPSSEGFCQCSGNKDINVKMSMVMKLGEFIFQHSQAEQHGILRRKKMLKKRRRNSFCVITPDSEFQQSELTAENVTQTIKSDSDDEPMPSYRSKRRKELNTNELVPGMQNLDMLSTIASSISVENCRLRDEANADGKPAEDCQQDITTSSRAHTIELTAFETVSEIEDVNADNPLSPETSVQKCTEASGKKRLLNRSEDNDKTDTSQQVSVMPVATELETVTEHAESLIIKSNNLSSPDSSFEMCSNQNKRTMVTNRNENNGYLICDKNSSDSEMSSTCLADKVMFGEEHTPDEMKSTEESQNVQTCEMEWGAFSDANTVESEVDHLITANNQQRVSQQSRESTGVDNDCAINISSTFNFNVVVKLERLDLPDSYVNVCTWDPHKEETPGKRRKQPDTERSQSCYPIEVPVGEGIITDVNKSVLNAKLFVVGLNKMTTENSLKEHFKQWGEIVHCQVFCHPENVKSGRRGYITYRESEMADNALNCKQHIVDGSEVQLKWATSRLSVKKQKENIIKIRKKRKLFVSDLTVDTVKTDIQKYFSKYGNILVINIKLPKETGAQRRSAFIEFESSISVTNVLREKRHVLKGNMIKVKRVSTRKETKQSHKDSKQNTDWNSSVCELSEKEQQTLTCDICEKTFSRIWTLKVHKTLHTGEKPYKCIVCQQSFRQSGALQSHQRIHTKEKPYKCGICGKSFNQPSSLKIHRRGHTGERPYLCDTCGTGFTSQTDLIRHKRTHSGEKPFQCTTCDNRFAQLANLKRHERIHTGEKPHKCKECGKAFRQPAHLTKHKKIHITNYAVLQSKSHPRSPRKAKM